MREGDADWDRPCIHGGNETMVVKMEEEQGGGVMVFHFCNHHIVQLPGDFVNTSDN